MIRSLFLNAVLILFGVTLVAVGLFYAFQTGPVPYYGVVALLNAGLGVWCLHGAIQNLRRRRFQPTIPPLLSERIATLTAVGVLFSLTAFIVLVTLDLGFGRNVDFDLLLSLAGAAGWFAVLGIPVIVWVAIARRRREHTKGTTVSSQSAV